jgi:hypothetical protein
MFIGADDIIEKKETSLQITKDDLDRIEQRQKLIIGMIIALALLTLIKK